LEELKEYLTNLGATQVVTYDELQADFKGLKGKVQQWTEGQVCNDNTFKPRK
jgi:hypothetical protein